MIKEKVHTLMIILASICLPIYSQVHIDASELADSVLLNDSLANYYGEKGELSKAQEYAQKNVAINRAVSGEKSVLSAIALLKLARYLYPNEREIDDNMSKDGLSILKDSLGVKSSTYIKFLLEYGWRQFNSGQIQEACNTVKVAAEKNYDDGDINLGYLYYSYAHFLKELEEEDKARKYAKMAESFFNEKEMWSDDYYTMTLIDLAYLCVPNKELSLSYLRKAKNIVEEIKGKDCIDYLDIILNIASFYRATSQLKEALDYAKQAKEIGEKIKQIDYGSYLYTLEFLAGRYSTLGQYNEAIKYAEECLTLMKERKEIAIEERLPTLDSLVAYNWYTSNIEKANLYAKEAFLIRKNSNISGDEMVRNLFYLLHSYYNLGKYEECETYVNETRKIYGETYSTNYKHYYDDMQVLADSYFKMKQYQNALDTSNEIYNTYMNQYKEETSFLATLFRWRGIYYSYIGDLTNYHDCTLKELDIIKKLYSANSPQYLYQLSTEANHFYNIGFEEESYNMFYSAGVIANHLYGHNNFYYVQNFLSAMTFKHNNTNENVFSNYKLYELYDYLLSIKKICDFTNSKGGLWNKKMKDYFQSFIQSSFTNILQKYRKDSLSMKALYNTQLLLKTKQENVDSLRTHIYNELDNTSQINYLDFLETNELCIQSLLGSDLMAADSLYKTANSNFDKLFAESSLYRSYLSEIYTFDDIKDNLREDEVVIDCFLQSEYGDDYNDYIVTFNKESIIPVFVPLTKPSEQIKQICNSYAKSYFLIDNDSIISNLNIDITKSNFIIGYDLSVDHIMNRGKNVAEVSSKTIPNTEKIKNLDYYEKSYKEFERGLNLYKKKLYTDAISAFYQCDSLMFLAKGEYSNYFGHGKHWISSCYHKLGLDSIAKDYSQYYYLQPVDMSQTILSDSILDIAARLYDDGKKREALEKYNEASKIEKSNVGKNYWYANTISHCAEICNELQEYERAIDYETEAIEIRKKSPGINHIDYYWSLKNLYDSYQSTDSINNLIYYGGLLTEYMETHWDLLGSERLLYPIYTSTMARVLYDKGELSAVYSYLQKAISSSELLLDYPFAYMNLHFKAIIGFELIEKDSLAFELCKKILPYYEKYQKEQVNPNEYFKILLFAANHYFKKGDYVTTSVYQERALDIVNDKNSPVYVTALSNLALTYSELGRIEESIKIAEDAVNRSDSTLYLEGYLTSLSNLAHCYAVANRPKDALRCGKKVYSIYEEKIGLNDYNSLVATNNLASYYHDLGYIEDSGKLLFLVIELARKDTIKYGEILGSAYNNLAMNWAREKMDFESCLEYIIKSYKIRSNILGDNNLYTIQSLFNWGRCLFDLGKYSEGVECIQKALNQTKSIIGENNLRYIEMMKILPVIYGKAGNLTSALEIAEKRYSLLKGLVDDNHIMILKALDDLSELYFYANDTIMLYSLVIEESQKYRNLVLSDFPNYTSVERENFVIEMSRFFDWLFPLVCYYKQQPSLSSEMYNALLLRKGILLNSEIELDKIIRESGDSTLISNYNNLIVNKNILNRQYQLPVGQRIFDIDSLRRAVNEKEDYLVSASKEYGDYTKRFRTNWKNIRDKLKDGELSVEFVEFYDTCAIQNRIYYALVINKYSDSPELVPLCMEQQIHEVMKGDNPGGLYKLIWNPILQKSKNVNTLFFSPAGILNNIGIEYVNINEHENISDKYAIYRLSSTREIIENQESACKSAALYGGLDYSVDTDVLLTQKVKSEIEMNSSVMYRGLSDSLAVRNSFEPLYNTKTEIAEIDKALKKGNVAVSMYSDTFGTEESFKALSGKGMNLIHLATHGMYIGASEAESKKRETNLSFIQLDDNEGGQIQEDKSLSRSFLVLSGGDMLPSHKEVPDNLEDGILTASEISRLDLRGLDLVVLSACQTALGDVDNEGVYGLQRGFKKAGANTILMSLDKVDDEATKILMVEFYRNLVNGKTKYQSLKDAQHYLRKVENGKYDAPKYWASFIMLDGLN